MKIRAGTIPQELKELCGLCSEGKLFAVQKWIADGKPFRMSEDGGFGGSPLQIAIRSKFHSLVEVLIQAGVSQREKDALLNWTALDGLYDYVKLLVEHGADPLKVERERIIFDGSPPIVLFLAKQGMDLERGWPIARALCRWPQKYLLVYGWLRSKFPNVRDQASMALRFHTCSGNHEWITRLVKAGANPRACVPEPMLSKKWEEPFMGTALEDAFRMGDEEVIREFKFTPAKDNPTELLDECASSGNPKIIQLLIDSGADPTKWDRDSQVLEYLVWRLHYAYRDSWEETDSVIQSLEILSRAGARWNPDNRRLRYFREAIAKAKPKMAISWLKRLVECGMIDRAALVELLDTGRMRQMLKTGGDDSASLREFAGLT